MKANSPRDTAVQWFENVWNKRSKAAVRGYFTESTQAHQEGGVTVVGPDEYLKFHDLLLAAFPDLAVRVLRSVGDEVQACVHWEASGTHRGPFAGVEATLRPVRFTGMTYMIVRDGKIVEGWDSWNSAGLVATLTAN